MNAVLRFIFCASFILFAGPVLADPSPAPSAPVESATVTGLVVDANNALPVVGAVSRH